MKGDFTVIFKSLIGNEDIKNTLGIAIKNSSFSHAYIIEGPKGSGKHTVARLASAAIMCKDKDNIPCEECITCQKILHDNCVDVRFYSAVKVDEVREIIATIYESTTECEYKVVVFNDADKLNPKAQNALLISLEEPPKNVVFFLLCQDAGALLETIRSRAQILRTRPLDNDTIFNHIRKNASTSLSDDNLMEIIIASQGSLGYVYDMLDSDKSKELIKSRALVKSFVTALLSSEAEAVGIASSMFAWQRDKLKDILYLCLVALRDLIVIKKSPSVALIFFNTHKEAKEISSPHSIKKLLNLKDAIESAIDGLAVNASVVGALSSIIANVKKKGR